MTMEKKKQNLVCKFLLYTISFVDAVVERGDALRKTSPRENMSGILRERASRAENCPDVVRYILRGHRSCSFFAKYFNFF